MTPIALRLLRVLRPNPCAWRRIQYVAAGEPESLRFCLTWLPTSSTASRLSARNFSSSTPSFKGHAHWKNVMHTKGANDMARSLITTRTAQMLRRAAIDFGSPDPSKNPEMAKIIERAKEQMISMDSLNNIVNKIRNKKTEPVLFDLKGPSGIMVIAEFLTDSAGRTEGELRYILKRTFFELVKGSAAQGMRFTFESKGVVMTKPPQGKVNMDKAEEDAIEVGAEEVSGGSTDEEIAFICDPMDVSKVTKGLKEKQYEILDAGGEYMAKSLMEVNDEQREELDKMLAKIEDHADFSKAYRNWS